MTLSMQIRDIPKSYMLIDRDYEIDQIMQDYDIKDSYSILWVKFDPSGTELTQIYGSNSPNLYAYAYQLYPSEPEQ